MSSNLSIRMNELGKCYEVYSRPSDRLRQMVLPRLNEWLGRPAHDYCQRFWALKGVSLNVQRGETVGIVGRNGSGKSTLLQLVCGTLMPSVGEVETHGRIGALLELGSGFNPDFTGVENVFLNAAVLGLTREQTAARIEAIAEFAGIGEFIHQPVKTYSSGMMIRLAFAVQAQTEPDILIVDEALAVGDARFQAKCFERLRQLKANGTSILLVTHSSEQIVTHCDRAVLMEDGHMLEIGEPKGVVNRYLDLLFGSDSRRQAELPMASVNAVEAGAGDLFQTRPNANPHEYRWGDGIVEITDFILETDQGSYPSAVESGEALRLSFTVEVLEPIEAPIFGITIKTREGITLYGSNTEKLGVAKANEEFEPGSCVHISFEFVCRLAQGSYFISLGVATREGERIVPHDRRYDAITFDVRQTETFFGLADLNMVSHGLKLEVR